MKRTTFVRRAGLAAILGICVVTAGCAQQEQAEYAAEEAAEEDQGEIDIKPPENDCAKADPGSPDCD